MKCISCSTETKNPKFCSRSCSTSHANRMKPKRKLTTKCLKCSDIIRNKRATLCQTHFDEWNSRFKKEFTVGEYRQKLSVIDKHPSWLHAHIRGFARTWLKHMTLIPCAKCGYDKHVELAHIRAVSDFNDDALLSEINSESNVIQLCRNCHWEFDNMSRTDFEDILKNKQ